MSKQMAEDKAEFQKMTEDMAFITKNHEAEVNLRLQFEAKLNGLHALHRDLKAKYKRATEDIFNVEALNKEVNEQIKVQKAELIELRTVKAES